MTDEFGIHTLMQGILDLPAHRQLEGGARKAARKLLLRLQLKSFGAAAGVASPSESSD